MQRLLDDLGWGLWMTVFGMGTVFLLLALLMGILVLIGRLDRPRPPALEDTREPAVVPAEPVPALAPAQVAEPVPGMQVLHDGLTRDQVAALALAVITHTRVRRAQAAPAMRSHQPGSHLYASRWVSAGRAQQIQTWRRS